MNTERILELAGIIEKLPHTRTIRGTRPGELTEFTMATWHCGSAGCIGGWTIDTYGSDLARIGDDAYAGELLGIGYSRVGELCYPDLSDIEDRPRKYADITPAQAARCLRILAETGNIDWTAALDEVPA